MGFAGLSFLGGAAKRGSELLQEERDNIEKVTDASLKFWTETGIGKYNERKNKRKDLSMKFATLANDHKFSADQIDVIARQGKTDDVLSYLATQRERNLAVEPSDVVRFSGDYKETGRTIDQMLDGVMGKVNSGMSVSDAIQDTTGKTTGFLGQDLGKIAQARVSAFSNAIGMPMGELRALSTDDITIEPSPVSGQLFMKDEVAAAQAREAVQGKGIKSTHETIVGRAAANYFRIKAKEDNFGNFTGFGGDNPAAIAAANRATLEAANKYEELLSTGKYSIPEVRLMLDDYVKQEAEKFLALPPTPQGKLGKDGKVIPSSNSAVSLPNYSGVPLKELGSRITTDLTNVPKGASRDAMVQHAQKTLQAAIMAEEGATESDALRQAVTRLKNLMGNL